MSGAYQFVFEPHVPLADAEMSLHLAMFAVEGLAGRVRVRMEANYHVDESGHAILIDASSRVGQMIARVFAGLLLREFGEDSFRIDRPPQHHAQADRQPEEAVA